MKNPAELVEIMDSASALIHVPAEEAFGLVVAEALARNLKFFGSKVGGIVDIVEGIEGAEVFEPEDGSGLEEAILKWLAAKGPKIKNGAKQVAQRYHPRVIAQRHLEIYQEVLAGGGRRDITTPLVSWH
jgi:glycosyltransferase involved in cell wall biosynthesis